jgi:predicted ferric reductase
MLSSKLLGKRASKPLTLGHEALSVAGLLMVGVHVVAILKDSFFHFGVAGVLVPGFSPYAPLPVGIGVVGAWLAAIIVASFYVRKKIGPRTWRRLHYTTLGLFIAMTLHGLLAGSDSSNPLAIGMYSVSTGTFAILLAYRLGYSVVRSRNRRAARAAHARPAL